MKYSIVPLAALAGLVLCLPSFVFAQEITATTAAPMASTGPSLAELAARQTALEARLVGVEAPSVKSDLSASGLRFSTADGYELLLKSLVQTDGNFYFDDEKAPKTNQFKMRRVRLWLNAKFAKHASLRIQSDFGQGKFSILDSYLEVTPWQWLGLRAGKFKTPVGLERLLSAPTLMFPDTSLTSTLTPNRDVGAMIFGTLGKGLLVYEAGIFNGVVDGGNGDLDNTDDKDVVGRVFAVPFVNSENLFLRGLGLGIGGSRGHQRGSYFEKTAFAPVQNLAQLKAAGGTTFFSFLSGASYAGTVVADGANQRLVPQGWYYVGPFGLVTEYVQTEHRVKRAGQSEDIRFDAWSATAGFVLTGEKAAPGKSVVPERPVGKGIGAWQVVGRLGSVIVDEDAFPKYANPARSARAARAAGVALNWYATANVRTSLAYEKTRFESAGGAVPALPAENFLLARLQVGFL